MKFKLQNTQSEIKSIINMLQTEVEWDMIINSLLLKSLQT
jgi:hypothetical protein